MVHFEVCVGKQTSTNGLETCVGCGQEDTTEMDYIAGVHCTSLVAISVNSHRTGNMAYRNLVRLQQGQQYVLTGHEWEPTISWILISWNGLNLHARVCMCNVWYRPFWIHVSRFGQSTRGVNCLFVISWKISEPQLSHV